MFTWVILECFGQLGCCLKPKSTNHKTQVIMSYIINIIKKKKRGSKRVLTEEVWSEEGFLQKVQIPTVAFKLGWGNLSWGATAGEKVLFFLIQVEGAAQECSSGSESRHPDGRQMLENISVLHVHFSWEDFPNIHKHSQAHTCVHRRCLIALKTTIKTRPHRASTSHSWKLDLIECV